MFNENQEQSPEDTNVKDSALSLKRDPNLALILYWDGGDVIQYVFTWNFFFLQKNVKLRMRKAGNVQKDNFRDYVFQ